MMTKSPLLVMLVAFTVLGSACSDRVTDPGRIDLRPAASVTPVGLPGNPACVDVAAGSLEFKPQPEPPPSGTYTDGVLSVTIDSDGTHFNWTADLVLVAVVVKGGPNANHYAYDSGATGDTGLSAPINERTGTPFAISHVSFCYTSDAIILSKLKVEKDAATRRTWSWTIDKSADAANLSLAEGQLFQVNYDVAVSARAEDVVSGVITITNLNDGLDDHGSPANEDIRINTVADLLTSLLAAAVVCDESLPHVLAATEVLQCRYTYTLGGLDPRAGNNVANVNATRVISASSAFNASFENDPPAPWSFDPPATEVDECVDVSDTEAGALGHMCASDAPRTFKYSVRIGKHPDADIQLVCGDNSHPNAASLVASESGATAQDDWTVHASVACQQQEQGCTLTPGYWKTHADVRNAKKYNPTWELVGGPGAPFFLSGKSYLQALNTARGGNAYYILAHAYIATRLNQLSGASMPQVVLDAFEDATDLFEVSTPASAAALKGAARNVWIDAAAVLDQYNNGILGPGHCSENGGP